MKLIIDKCKNMNVKLQLEEYIPLKVVIEDIEEPVNYFSYSKGNKSENCNNKLNALSK